MLKARILNMMKTDEELALSMASSSSTSPPPLPYSSSSASDHEQRLFLASSEASYNSSHGSNTNSEDEPAVVQLLHLFPLSPDFGTPSPAVNNINPQHAAMMNIHRFRPQDDLKLSLHAPHMHSIQQRYRAAGYCRSTTLTLASNINDHDAAMIPQRMKKWHHKANPAQYSIPVSYRSKSIVKAKQLLMNTKLMLSSSKDQHQAAIAAAEVPDLQPYRRDEPPRLQSTRPGGRRLREVFRKKLTRSDVSAQQDRLLMPRSRRGCLGDHRTPTRDRPDVGVDVWDESDGRKFPFVHGFWPSSGAYMLKGRWRSFCECKRADAGDVVVISVDDSDNTIWIRHERTRSANLL